jgi:hypothetical protein
MDPKAHQNQCGNALILAATCITAALWSLSCGGGGSTAVVPAPSAGFSLNPTIIDFAKEGVGSTSTPLTATLTNLGSAPLTLSSVQLTGSNAGDFKLTNHCGSALAASAECSLAVTFAPSAAGNRTASVVFNDNAAGSPQTLELNGIGALSAEVSLAPQSLSFGNQPVATISSTETITLSNSGNTAVKISGLAIGGANSGDFADIADTCGSSLEAGGACTVGVTFNPSSAGQRTATLSVTDDASGSPQTASFTGTGTPDVMLSWSASPTAGVVGYDVYRGTSPGGESSIPLNSTPITGSSYVDENVTAGTTYYYVLTSVGADGVQSARSSETEAKVPAS